MQKCPNCGKKLKFYQGYQTLLNKQYCDKECYAEHRKKVGKKSLDIPEKQKDAMVSAIISAIVMLLLYFFFFRHIFDLFSMGTGLRWIMMIFFWGSGTGLLTAMTAIQKATQKIAYGK